MNRRLILLPLIFAVLVLGCIPSLQPLYTESDLIEDQSFPGLYRDTNPENSEGTWEFKATDSKAYNLVIRDKENKSGKFVAHLVKVQNHTFLDIQPQEQENPEETALFNIFLLRAHGFFLAEQTPSGLNLRIMEPGWLEKHLQANPQAIEHVVVEKRLILTASTKELQAFAAKHVETEGAYGKPLKLQREQPPGK